MPGKRYQEKQPYDFTFAAVELTGEDYDAFDIWIKTEQPDYEEMVSITLDEGYKISTRQDTEDGIYLCSISMSNEAKHHNKGLIISSRGESPAEALFFCLYKTHVMYKGKRIPAQDGRRRRG